MTALRWKGVRSSSAPVKGPMKGTAAASAMGLAAADVGVPTGPIRAKTPSPSSFFVASIERFGS